jgi:pyruvate/2-oxoglutarate dehydrogenase complex dihydrolipoamide acyltransferase (E2) component
MKVNLSFLLLPLIVACGGGEAPAPAEPPPAAEAAPAAEPAAAPAAAAPTEAAAAPADAGSCEGLSEYEGFVDAYIKALEDMHGGNVSAAASLVGLQGKAQKAGESLAKLKPGTDCFNRYIAIQKKMTEAAMKMNKAGASAPKVDVAAATKQLEKANDALGCMQKCNSVSDPMKKMSCLQGCQ